MWCGPDSHWVHLTSGRVTFYSPQTVSAAAFTVTQCWGFSILPKDTWACRSCWGIEPPCARVACPRGTRLLSPRDPPPHTYMCNNTHHGINSQLHLHERMENRSHCYWYKLRITIFACHYDSQAHAEILCTQLCLGPVLNKTDLEASIFWSAAAVLQSRITSVSLLCLPVLKCFKQVCIHI